MRIAIDIDGILTVDTKGHDYKNRVPNALNISKVNALYNYKGNVIILYTSRYWRDWFVTRRWLKKYDVHYHRLVMRKLKYNILIDDKAFCYFNKVFN